MARKLLEAINRTVSLIMLLIGGSDDYDTAIEIAVIENSTVKRFSVKAFVC